MAWLAGWSYRKTVTITGQAGAGTDYQVDFSIGDAAGGDFNVESHCTSFPNDIQVTDNNQTTTLDYWVEDLTVDPITMWVEVADDLGSNVDICVYYRKSGASSERNISNTFLFGDDFPGSSLDTDKWTETGSVSIADSIVTLQNGDILDGKTSFGTGYALHSYASMFYVNIAGQTTIGFNNGLRDTNDALILRYGSVTPFKLNTEKDSSQTQTEMDETEDSNWHIFKILRISSSSVKGQIDSGAVKENTTGIPTASIPPTLYTRPPGGDSLKNATLKIDWVFVRKCQAAEPAFSSAGSEESAAAATIPIFMHSYRNLRET